jgi:rod shape-determining protein MreD
VNSVGFAMLRDGARKAVPALTTLFLLLLAQLPLPLPFYPDIAPVLPLMAVYYWVVFRPDLMPRLLVFAVGIVHDALAGAPFGLTAAILLLTHGFVLSQRRFLVGKPFWIFWSGFAIVVPVSALLSWILASVLRGAFLPTDVVFVGIFMTVVTFPAVAWLLLRSQRWLVGPLEPA